MGSVNTGLYMFSKGYALGACVIALLKIFWGIERIHNPGKIYYGSWSIESVMVPIDLLWTLVSALAIFLFVGKKPWLSPISFLLYSVIMTFLVAVAPSLMVIAKAVAHSPSSSLDPISSVGMVDGVVGILFGIYYAIVNICFWVTLIAENKS